MNSIITKLLLVSCLLLYAAAAPAQINSISLDNCYVWAKQNYPLIKQKELITRSRDYSIDNLSDENLPQLSIQGQATYQSDVTRIPIHIPGMDIPGLSKDQYRIYGEVTQNLYDGGIIKTKKQLQKIGAKVQDQQLEVTLYALKERINRLFFGILLLDEKLKQNNLLKKDIQLGLDKIQAAIANGAALKSNADILKAELLKADQQSTELTASRSAFYKMLGMFIHQPLNDSTRLVIPASTSVSEEIRRPELGLFKYENDMLKVKNKMLTSRVLPKLNLFVQGGAGRPALDMLNNNFKAYYIGGIRMSIPLSGFYTLKKERALINIRHQKIKTEQETFLFNTRLVMQRQNSDLVKLQKLLLSDDAIIQLHQSIKTTALSQLQNGIINSNDYLKDVNALDRARQNKLLHQIQLLMTQYDQKITSGN